MKRVLLGVILGTITFILILVWQYYQVRNKYTGYEITIYKLQNKNYRFLVADNPAKWERGLMFLRKLEGVDGMIFEFPDEAFRNFWNKNTFMNLTLYWIDNNLVVGTSNLPSIEVTKDVVTVSSPQKVNTVVELPQ